MKRASANGEGDGSDDEKLAYFVDMQDAGIEMVEVVKDKANPKNIERKIMIGYVCLLIGAVVRKSTNSRSVLVDFCLKTV